MSRTSRRTWQRAEGRAAGLFGSRRQVGSGSNGRDDQTASDSTHPRLFLECKYRLAHGVRSLHDETKEKAAKENGKVPILALFDKNRHGCLLVIHCDDFKDVAIEFFASLDPEERDRLVALIEEARDRATTREGRDEPRS